MLSCLRERERGLQIRLKKLLLRQNESLLNLNNLNILGEGQPTIIRIHGCRQKQKFDFSDSNPARIFQSQNLLTLAKRFCVICI